MAASRSYPATFRLYAPNPSSILPLILSAKLFLKLPELLPENQHPIRTCLGESISLSLFLPAPCSDPLAELHRIFRNSLVSAHTKRACLAAFNQFFALVSETGRPVSRVLLMEYRAQMIDQGLSASTINVRLSAIRKLVSEARENNLLHPAEAARLLTVPGAPTRRVRLGHWLPPGRLNVFWLSPTTGV